jgi:hypothetical protein
MPHYFSAASFLVITITGRRSSGQKLALAFSAIYSAAALANMTNVSSATLSKRGQQIMIQQQQK